MSSTERAAVVQPGDILASKYRVDRVLGAGGMGVVVAAHHLQLDERVAIKFLLPEALGDAGAVARFEREARAAVKIKSEHVARIIDVGALETGAPYIVMEYLDGHDLADWLVTRGPASCAQAADFVVQACEALAEAHALGIVHRDLKPANLFCVRRADGIDAVKVLDFGISKATLGKRDDVTRSQSLLGSPLYMSPEQMQTPKSVDQRTDLWSLGVILYELVTRRVPFDGETLPQLVLQIVGQDPRPLRALRADLPEAFVRVVERCLEKKRELRFQHVGELVEALAPFAPARCAASIERTVRTAGGARTDAPISHFKSTQPVTHDARLTPVPLGPPLGTLPPGQITPMSGIPASVASAPRISSATASSWGNTSPEMHRPPVTPTAKGPYLAVAGAVVACLALLAVTQGSRFRSHDRAAAGLAVVEAAAPPPTLDIPPHEPLRAEAARAEEPSAAPDASVEAPAASAKVLAPRPVSAPAIPAANVPAVAVPARTNPAPSAAPKNSAEQNRLRMGLE